MNTEKFIISDFLLNAIKGLVASVIFSVICVILLSLLFTTLDDPGNMIEIVPPLILILSGAVGGITVGLSKSNQVLSSLAFAVFQLIIILITGIILPQSDNSYSTIVKCGAYALFIIIAVIFSRFSSGLKDSKKKLKSRKKRRTAK